MPSLKKINVGVVLTPYSLATTEPIPTPRSTLTNATPALALECARSSNTGSTTLQGGQVVEVKKTATALCRDKMLFKEAELVAICSGADRTEDPLATVTGGEPEARAATDCKRESEIDACG
jgi:hypothetical protein